uniref:CAP-Gly domain-containing protein n=1 Tax=Anopheles atroparvus TaxID=41427 RepID=A0AAG5DSE9_ANOAO
METETPSDATSPPTVGNGRPAQDTANGAMVASGSSGIQPPKARALTKPSGIRPPSANVGGSTTSLASTSSQLTTASAAASGTATTASSRIGRLCMGHTPPKAGPPPPEPKLSTLESKMRRPSESDFNKSHLADVDEESETDLAFERPVSSRSSHSPDSGFKSNRSDRKTSSASTGSDVYWEATGRRRSSDQGAVLTTDTDSFIIGQRVWVGGIRPGQIAYIGETHFAPGEWAGVVLDEPNGKNDGSVAGKRYFQCEAKKGVFSRLTRLTREPLAAGDSGAGTAATTPLDHSFRSLTSPARSGTVSPTHSVQSYASKSPAVTGKAASLNVGDRVIVSSGFGSRPGILKYLGETQFASGTWCGVQLDEGSGKNDGTVDGVRYFECPAKYGIFVPIAKVTLSPSARKTSARLSRANSKESLNSMATMSSIATTATSRLRMSAQRKSTVSAVPSTPKASFSLQDVLREKQNHIEQLMQEREIDREENANQSIMYQKNIQQLKEKVALLEKSLADEKRRNEDLQFSVDEVTFCGEELNAQTQVFKEKIAELEAQLADGAIGKTNDEQQSVVSHDHLNAVRAELNAEIDKLKAEILTKDQKLHLTEELKRSLENEIQKLHEKVADVEHTAAGKLSTLTIREECLKEQISYLEHRVDEQSDQLTAKDAELEQQYLALKNAESEQDERVAALQSELRAIEADVGEREQVREKLEATLEELRNDLRQRDLKMAEGETGMKVLLQEKDILIGKLQGQLADLEERIASVGTLRDQLEQELATKNKTISSLQVEHDGKVSLLKQLESKLSASEVSLQAETVLRQEKESMVAKLKEEISTLTATSEARAAELAAKQEELTNQAEQLEKVGVDNTDLKKELAKMKDTHEKARSEQDVLIAELHALVDTERKTIEELRKKLSASEQENLTKDKQLEESEMLVDALQKELKELNVANANLAQELAATKSSFADKDGTLSKMVEEKNALQAQLEQTKEEMATKVKQLEEDLRQGEVTWREDAEKKDAAAKLELSAKDTDMVHLEQVRETVQKELELTQQQLKEALEAGKNSMEAIASKTAEALSLEQLVASLRVEVSSKAEQVDKLNLALTEGTNRQESSDRKLAELQEQLGRLEIERADLRRKMEALEHKSAQVLQQKQDLEKDLDTLRSTTLDSNSELAKASEELKVKQRALEELRDSYDTLKIDMERRLDESCQANAGLQEQVERVRQEMQHLSDQKIIQENELNTELRKIKEIAEQEKDNLEREIATLRTSFNEERQRISNELEEATVREASLKEQLSLLQGRLEQTTNELRKELENVRAEKFKDQEQYETNNKEALGREDGLKKQLEDARVESAGLRETLDELRKSMEQGSLDLATQIDHKTQQILKLEKELAEERSALEKRSAEFSELVDKYDTSTKTHTEMMRQMNDCYSQIETLTKAKEESEQSCQEIRLQLEQLNSSYSEMEEEQVDLVSREETVKVELKQLQERMEVVTAERKNREAELMSENELLTKQLEEMSSVQATVEAEATSLRDQLETLSTAAAELHSRITELGPLVQTKETLEKKIETLEQSVSEKEASILDLTSSLEASRKEGTAKGETVAAKEGEIVKLRESVASKDVQLNELQQQLDTVQKSLSESTELGIRFVGETTDLKEALDRARTTQKEQDERVKEQQRRITELETKLVAQTTQFDELLDRKKSSETENSHRVHELNQRLLEIENGKRQEIEELQQRLAEMLQRVENQVAETAQTASNKRTAEKRQQELECAKKDLELRETELQLANRRLEKDNEHLRAQMLAKDSELAKFSKAAASAATAANAPERPRVGEMKQDESGAQIDFLNSIIVDMQRKNEKLTLRIQALESTSAESANLSFEIQKRKPAPRVFCDICDEFDLHETEDCPKQCSDSPPESLKHPTDGKERKVPPPRKYCESCEVFGHEIGECPDDETY